MTHRPVIEPPIVSPPTQTADVGEPLCIQFEDTDMEAFASLPDCESCEGTGKNLSSWPIRAVETVPLALTAFVAGKPAPQGSKRGIATRHGKVAMIESSKNVKPWRESIRHALLDEHGKARATYPDGPIHVRLEFVMPRPTSTPKQRTPAAVKRPDLDKLVRAVLDAISSAGVWKDDSQVTRIDTTKRLAEIDEQPGCHIAISEVR